MGKKHILKKDLFSKLRQITAEGNCVEKVIKNGSSSSTGEQQYILHYR